MSSAPSGPVQRVRSVLAATLLGSVVFAAGGLAELAILAWRADYVDVLREMRFVAASYAAVGAVAGLLVAAVAETWLLRRWKLHRGVLYLGTLLVLLGLGEAVVWTPSLLGPEVPLRSATALGLLALEALVAVALLGLVGRTAVARARHAGLGRVPLRAPAVAGALGTLVLAVALPLRAAVETTAPSSEAPPNVILLVMDTTRFDRLSLYGYPRETTPHLERIAAEGAAFDRAYSASPWTLPAHASIFTGLYPSVHGATAEHTRLEPSPRTIAERATQRGLRSVAISKKTWLSDETGMFRGFQDVRDLYDAPPRTAVFKAADWMGRTLRGRPYDKGATEVTDTAIAWIGRHGDEPFFLFLNYNEAHNDLFPPSPFRERFLGELADTPWGRTRFPDMIASQLGEETYTEEELAILSHLYDASVAYQDHRMGQLFEYLRDRDLLDRTLVVVTADHGEHLGDHGLIGHNLSIADALLRVPLVVRYPPRVPAGARVDDRVVETRRIGELVERILAEPRGRPLDAAALGRLLSERRDGAVIAETYRPFVGRLSREKLPDDPRYHRRRKAIVLDDLKYVWSSDGNDELYDVSRDPGELRNLASERPETVAKLRRILESEPDLWRDFREEDSPQLSEELQERLRAVGYLP